jgi:calcineurin-like phosphoesterase family protein
MWYFSADWHLGHSNIIKYCNRPFISREEEGLLSLVQSGSVPMKELKISRETTDRMTDSIIENTNAVVGENDSLVLLGDFCWTPVNNRREIAREYLKRINCRNVFLIWGNHDDRRALSGLFNACYDQYIFTVDGQKIFTSHYPCRSWDRSTHGSWMLYGHVHNFLSIEDNGHLLPYEKKVYDHGFRDVLMRYGIENSQIVQDLLSVCESTKGIDFTLDVGIDNHIRGSHIPFGTPWSFTEICEHMKKKKDRWNLRDFDSKEGIASC